MNKNSCPNCGAPVHSLQCPYCGTLHCSEKELARISVGRKARVEFEADDGHLISFELFIERLTFDQQADILYSFGTAYRAVNVCTDVSIEGQLC